MCVVQEAQFILNKIIAVNDQENETTWNQRQL